MGQAVGISSEEWEAAKRETLNDIYANRFCYFGSVASDYFVNTTVGVLAVMKQSESAA